MTSSMRNAKRSAIADPLLERLINTASASEGPWINASNQWRLLKFSLILNDFLMLGLAFRLAYWIRFETGLEIFHLEVTASRFYYFRFLPTLFPVWLSLAIFVGLYNKTNLLGGIKEYALTFRTTTITMLLVVVIGFVDPFFVIARGWLLLSWALAFLCVAGGRFWIRRLVYYLRKRCYFVTPALILGANVEGRSLIQQLSSWKTSGLRVAGVVDDHANPGTQVFDSIQVLGGLDALEHLIARLQIEELIIAPSAFTRNELVNVFKHYGFSERVNLRLASGLYEMVTTGLEVKEFGFVPLVQVNKVRLTGLDSVMKLVLDYTLATVTILATLPLQLVIALLVKLDSPGPVLHYRRAMGLNGREYNAIKFRTMYVNGDKILADRPELKAILEQEHKLKDDPRVTRIGRLLRQFSLDELPQLINVFRGEMSLVGPRMISPIEMANYNQWGHNLLTVRPGITGLWQVSGRSDISYEERVHLDMHYIRNWTIWLDLHLLIRTLPAVLGRRGAY